MRRLAVPLAWAAVIFFTSSTVVTRGEWLALLHRLAPGLATPEDLDRFWQLFWWVFVKGYHVLEFFLLFSLGMWSLRWDPRRRRLVAMACLLYAVSDEVHQHFVGQRGGRWTDVAIDAIGIALGWWFAARRSATQGRRSRGTEI